jgi:hypothetical protein
MPNWGLLRRKGRASQQQVVFGISTGLDTFCLVSAIYPM